MKSAGIVDGDYAEVDIPAGQVALIVTSPPYPGLRDCRMDHAQWLAWFEPLLEKMFDELRPNGVLCLNVNAARAGGQISAEFWAGLIGLLRGWHWVDWMAWDKINPAPAGAQRGGRRYDLPGWESVFVAAKSADYVYQAIYAPYAAKTIQKAQSGRMRGRGVAGHYGGGHDRLSQNGAYQTNVIRISPSGGRLARPRARGQSFPVELTWRLISTYSAPGDLVMDPFCGAGTTCYAARLLGRRWLGVEIDPATALAARRWLANDAGSPAVNGGERPTLLAGR